jgi:arylsulfatase A-like enzyme
MRRATTIITLLGALVLTGLPASLPAPARPNQRHNDKPNILIIVTDDQRGTGTLEYMKNTRRIFRKEGTQFEHAFATTPLCCPSRASIMSGLYAHNHKVRSNTGEEVAYLDHRFTIQSYLQQAGYATGIYGKYLNDWDIERPPPYFNDWTIYARGVPYYRGTYNVNGQVEEVHKYSTTLLEDRTERFVKLLEHDDSRPWFAYVATAAPHGPAFPEFRHRNKHVKRWYGNRAVFEYDRTDKPPVVQTQHKDLEDGRRVRRNQLRSLASVDDMVKQIFKTLDRLKEDNTLAFFVSDNGEMWSEHGLLGKTFPYSYSIEIPFLMRWPGHVEEGAVDNRVAANIDITPTILDAAGLTAPRPLDGQSLLTSMRRSRLLLEYWKSPDFGTEPWASLRTDHMQYVEWYDDRGAVTFREYYNLDKDPWQLQNLLGDLNPLNDPDVKALSDQLARDRQCSGASCP